MIDERTRACGGGASPDLRVPTSSEAVRAREPRKSVHKGYQVISTDAQRISAVLGRAELLSLGQA